MKTLSGTYTFYVIASSAGNMLASDEFTLIVVENDYGIEGFSEWFKWAPFFVNDPSELTFLLDFTITQNQLSVEVPQIYDIDDDFS